MITVESCQEIQSNCTHPTLENISVTSHSVPIFIIIILQTKQVTQMCCPVAKVRKWQNDSPHGSCALPGLCTTSPLAFQCWRARSGDRRIESNPLYPTSSLQCICSLTNYYTAKPLGLSAKLCRPQIGKQETPPASCSHPCRQNQLFCVCQGTSYTNNRGRQNRTCRSIGHFLDSLLCCTFVCFVKSWIIGALPTLRLAGN